MAAQSLAITDLSASRTELSNSPLERADYSDHSAWLDARCVVCEILSDHSTFTADQSHSSHEPEQAPAASHGAGPKSARIPQAVLAPYAWCHGESQKCSQVDVYLA